MTTFTFASACGINGFLISPSNELLEIRTTVAEGHLSNVRPQVQSRKRPTPLVWVFKSVISTERHTLPQNSSGTTLSASAMFHSKTTDMDVHPVRNHTSYQTTKIRLQLHENRSTLTMPQPQGRKTVCILNLRVMKRFIWACILFSRILY